LVATIEYATGSGEMIEAHKDGLWSSVSTTCSVPASEVGIANIRITNAGEAYTSPPTAKLTGGGGTYDATTVTVRSPIHSISVVEGGSGYSTRPSVTITTPANGGRLTQATAEAVIEGKLATVTLQQQGSGYSSPPAVSVAGGSGAVITPTMDGYVANITLTNKGEKYTSSPSVSISGGGGSGATAFATIDKTTQSVSGVTLILQGSGYTSAPTVKFSGGGGEGAAANAALLYSVKSLTLDKAGTGYPESPTVTIEGGGGVGATATATISGSVVSIDVLNPGLYQSRKSSTGVTQIEWPQVTLSGNATAAPVFSAILTGVTVSSSSGYSSAPTVSFSGSEGKGAAAVAELTWEPSHERSATFSNCFANVLGPSQFCFDRSGSTYPPSFPFSNFTFCLDHRESIDWDIVATSSHAAAQDAIQNTSGPLSQRFFEGECFWARVYKQWQVIGFTEETQPEQSVRPIYTELEYHVGRLFSRTEPDVVFRLSQPAQEEADNVSLTPTVKQYVDRKGDSVWYIESLEITEAADNLNIPVDGVDAPVVFILAADGNSRHSIQGCEFTFVRALPELQAQPISGFSIQPTFSFPLTSPGAGFYAASPPVLTSGGETALPDGQIEIAVELVKGHPRYINERFAIAGTISGGTLTQIEWSEATVIRAPASLASVTLPADPLFANPNLFMCGESPFVTSTTHTEPEVQASAEHQGPGTPAEFTVNLQEETDENQNAYWRVLSVTVDDPGQGYTNSQSVVFEPLGDSIEQFPAVAVTVLDRDQPTVNGFPQGSGFGASFEVYLQKQTTPQGDDYWEIQSVYVVNAGQGYVSGDVILFFAVAGEQTAVVGTGSLQVNNLGAVTGVTVTAAGQFYKPTSRVKRVIVISGGKFFEREISETTQRLPAVTCRGGLTEENGWQVSRQQMISTDKAVDVDDAFAVIYGANDRINRVRRCGFPQFTLEYR
jgi:hypothetical protein